MKQRRFFQTQEQASSFADGLAAANDGHIHSIRTGQSTSAHLQVNPYWVEWVDENKHAAELPEKCPPLTPQEYVAHRGALCPVCRGSDRLEGRSVEIDNGITTQPVSCMNPDCEASWVDYYELSGYDQLER